jgi:hypothetical protein
MYISYELYQADHVKTTRGQREEAIRASGQRRFRQTARAVSSAQTPQARPGGRHRS